MNPRLYLEKFTKLFRRYRLKKSSGLEGAAARHWKIFLIVFGVTVACLFIWSFFMYKDIASGEFFLTGQKAPSTRKILDEESIDKIIKTFETNDATFKSLRLSDTPVVDPSR